MPGSIISSLPTNLGTPSNFSNESNVVDGDPDTFAVLIAPNIGSLQLEGFEGIIPNVNDIININFYTTYYLLGNEGDTVDINLVYKFTGSFPPFGIGTPLFTFPNNDIGYFGNPTTINYNFTSVQRNNFIENIPGNDLLTSIDYFGLQLINNNMPNTRVYEAGIKITYKTPTLVNINNSKISPQVNTGTTVSNITDFGNSRCYSPNKTAIKVFKPTEKYFFTQGRIQNAASSAPFSTDGAGSVILNKSNTIAPSFEVNNPYYLTENHSQFFLANSNDETGYSYEFWIKPNSFNPTFSYLLNLRGYYISYASQAAATTGHFMTIGFNTSGQLRLIRDYAGLGSDVGDVQDFSGTLDYTFNTDEWYHIVLSTFVRDLQGNPNGLTDGRCNLYINGIPIIEPSGDISSVSPSVENEYEGLCFDYRNFQATQVILGGNYNGASADKFDGKISYFALHDKRFTAEEVKHNYNSLKPRYIN